MSACRGVAAFLSLAVVGELWAAEALPPIEKVEITVRRSFLVNGKPFFPLMAWLQDAANLATVKECGMHTTAGYWPGSGGTKDVGEYLPLVAGAGLYGVLPYDARLIRQLALLAYIHGRPWPLPDVVRKEQFTVCEAVAGNNSRRRARIVECLPDVAHESTAHKEGRPWR